MTKKGIYTKTVNRHITKGRPRAARFAVSTDVCCKSPEQGVLVALIFVVLYDFYGSYNGQETVKSLTLFHLEFVFTRSFDGSHPV